MHAPERHRPRLGLWTLLLITLFVTAPAAYPGYWLTQDGFVPALNIVQSGPIASVATLPDLWRGTGRAAFLPAQPLLMLGLSPAAALRATFALAFLLGGLGVYVWLQPRWGDRAAALAGALYVLLPPVLATAYWRGSVADALIAGLLPLALAGLASYTDSRSLTGAGVTVLSVLWMWRIQPGLAAGATLLLLAYAWWVERSGWAMVIAAVAGLAGLTSLLPLWSVHAPAAVAFADHFVHVGQLFIGQWATPAANATPVYIPPATAYPYQIGAIAWVFALAALWLWARRVGGGDVTTRLLSFGAGSALILIGLSLTWAAPLWQITGAARLFTYPWQLILLAAPGVALLAGSLPALNAPLRRAPLWLVLAGLALLGSYPYLQPTYTQTPIPARPVATLGLRPDLLLLSTDVREELPATAADRRATLEVTWQTLHPLPFDYSVFFQALTTTPTGEQVVAQLDAQPRQGLQPATTWLPGQILTDTYTLDLSGWAGAGELRYVYGLYDWRDGSRLPVDGGIDDKLTLHGR